MLKPKAKITKKEMKKDPLLETINTVFEKYYELPVEKNTCGGILSVRKK